MSSKIAYLSELESVLCNNEKTDEGVLHLFSTFRIRQFLTGFGSFKSKGFDVCSLLLSLLIFRLRSESICTMQNQGKNLLERIDDNTCYRLMNNPWMDWRKLLMLGFWYGKNHIATDFSLHREKWKKGNCGLSPKELNRRFGKKRDSKSPGHKRVEELDKLKGEVAVSMLRRTVP